MDKLLALRMLLEVAEPVASPRQRSVLVLLPRR
jgi:hypothetical protein